MNRTTRPIITLTTDFGTRDSYVAEMKGVIATIAPDARLIDITHEVTPHDVRHAGFVLHQVWSRYPEGTIHLAVVDPGVGTDRRIVLGRYAGRFVVAPDNGLVTFVHRAYAVEAMHVVEHRRFMLAHLSATFHGRDIMAPVSAHLACGAAPRDFGRATDRIELLTLDHRATRRGDEITGDVLHVDHFGALITNVGEDQLANPPVVGGWRVIVDDQPIGPVCTTFSDVPSGEPLALIGSSGRLEIAVCRGRAVDRFGASPSIRVIGDRHGEEPVDAT